jgi:hypothetical protein
MFALDESYLDGIIKCGISPRVVSLERCILVGIYVEERIDCEKLDAYSKASFGQASPRNLL